MKVKCIEHYKLYPYPLFISTLYLNSLIFFCVFMLSFLYIGLFYAFMNEIMLKLIKKKIVCTCTSTSGKIHVFEMKTQNMKKAMQVE